MGLTDSSPFTQYHNVENSLPITPYLHPNQPAVWALGVSDVCHYYWLVIVRLAPQPRPRSNKLFSFKPFALSLLSIVIVAVVNLCLDIGVWELPVGMLIEEGGRERMRRCWFRVLCKKNMCV